MIFRKFTVLNIFSNRLLSNQFRSPFLRMASRETFPKIIVRHQDDDPRLSLKFSYDFGHKTRKFNFNRAKDETVSSLLERMTTNIIKRSTTRKKRKTAEGDVDAPTNWTVTLLAASVPLPDIIDFDNLKMETVCGDTSCMEVFITGSERHLLCVAEQHYRIDLNPPSVDAVSLPDNIMVGYNLHPNYLDLSHGCVEHSVVRWFISHNTFDDYQKAKAIILAIKWRELTSGFTLKVTEDMIGRLLKVVVEPRQGERVGESEEAFARCLVKPGIGACPYQLRHQYTSQYLPQDGLRVVSYNILADTYASTNYSAEHLFPCCPQYALELFYRRQLIFDEILGYNADVVCLQEVDEEVFKYDLSRVLPHLSPLQGFYTGKLSNSTKEGAATFYNTNKFRLQETINYGVSEELTSNPALAAVWEKLQQHPVLEERVTTRSTVLQACVLERLTSPPEFPTGNCNCTTATPNYGVTEEDGVTVASNARGSGKELLVVCNSHFYFHPDADHIRLLQSVVCFALIEQLVRRLEEEGHRVSVVFCGDLNSSPDTGVYQLATQGHVDDTHPGWGGASDTESGMCLSFRHTLPFASACGEPEYTNYVVNFNACLDWIFYQTDRLAVTQVVELPSHEVVTANKALPSVVIPSDHLALVADLKFL